MLRLVESSNAFLSPCFFQNENDQSVVPEATAESYTFQVPNDQSTFQF